MTIPKMTEAFALLAAGKPVPPSLLAAIEAELRNAQEKFAYLCDLVIEANDSEGVDV